MTLPAPFAASPFRWLGLPAMAAMISAVGLMLWHWRGGLPYDVTSGVWSALADDVARGTFYRPVVDGDGYGGTRYMPLFFTLHGALMRAGVPLVAAGALLTIGSALALLAAVFAVVRTSGGPRGIALAAAGVVPASIAFQLLTLSTKADLMAAAFNLWGLVWALRAMRSRSPAPLLVAGALLGLAVLTKFTAVFGLVTVALGLLYARRGGRPRQTALAGVAALMIALGVIAAWVASDGRIAEAFAVAGTGGMDLAYAWRFPAWFLGAAVQDPFFFVLFLAAALAAVRRARRRTMDVPLMYFAVTTVLTMLVFVSPGTDGNHLIDLLLASVWLIAAELSAGEVPARVIRAAALALFVGIAATWLPGVPSVTHFLGERGRPTFAHVEEIRRRLPSGAGERLLSENPLLPLLLGQRPEVLDPFSVRLIAERSPVVRDEFIGRVQRSEYGAIVLTDWSGAPLAERWAAIEAHGSRGVNQFYGDVHFPRGFLAALAAGYRPAFVAGPFVVFESRTTAR